MGLLVFLYPIAEVTGWYYFIDKYSFMDAFWLCSTTGIVGLMISSMQGRAFLAEMNRSQGQVNGQVQFGSRAFHRLIVMFGGLFLFVPGLFIKAAGTFMILPGTRHIFLWVTKSYFSNKVVARGFQFFMNNVPGGGGANWKAEASDVTRDVFEIKPVSIEHQVIDDDPTQR